MNLTVEIYSFKQLPPLKNKNLEDLLNKRYGMFYQTWRSLPLWIDDHPYKVVGEDGSLEILINVWYQNLDNWLKYLERCDDLESRIKFINECRKKGLDDAYVAPFLVQDTIEEQLERKFKDQLIITE
jgi:hypothetical protein